MTMCNYKIDRFCGKCSEKVKNAVANNIFWCPFCGLRLRKGRINGRHKYIKVTLADKTLNKKIAKIKRARSLVSRTS